MSREGYIKLSRRFFDHQFWNNRREYSRAEAFLDFIQNANYVPKKVMIGNTTIHLERGQQVASLRFLADRWKWSAAKAKRFMDVLKAEQMVKHEMKQCQSVITLCNYETYNSLPDKDETDNETQCGTGAKQERNRSETKQKKGIRKESKNRGSLDDCIAYATSLDLPPTDGQWFFDSMEAGGWTRGGKPLKDWQAHMRSYKAQCWLPSLKAGHNSDSPKEGEKRDGKVYAAGQWRRVAQ